MWKEVNCFVDSMRSNATEARASYIAANLSQLFRGRAQSWWTRQLQPAQRALIQSGIDSWAAALEKQFRLDVTDANM